MITSSLLISYFSQEFSWIKDKLTVISFYHHMPVLHVFTQKDNELVEQISKWTLSIGINLARDPIQER